MTAPKRAIRIRTYLRYGTGTRLVEDKVLRPLTPEERKSGEKDEYGAFVAAHGAPGSRRKVARKASHPFNWGCGPGVTLDLTLQEDGMPSKADQKAIYDMMHDHIALLVSDLVSSGIVPPANRHDAEMEFFFVCRDSFTQWDPRRAGLRTFFYECLASAKVDYARRAKCEKSALSHKHVALVSNPADDEDVQDDSASILDVVDAETIPDRHALERMLFAWALSDLLHLLDPDEKLALDYLLQNLSQSETADSMGMSLMHFRRHVLRSLQRKSEFCGFGPHRGTVTENY